MKKYMKAMYKNYLVKNLVNLGHAGNGMEPAEMLNKNSYALLNVSPRFF